MRTRSHGRNWAADGSCYLRADSSLRCVASGVYHHVRIKKELHVQKRGATLLQFTHHPSCLLYTSTKPKFKGCIQYHSLHDNKLLRLFEGHTDTCVALYQRLGRAFASYYYGAGGTQCHVLAPVCERRPIPVYVS